MTNAVDPCAIVPLPQTVDPAAAFAPVAGQPALVRAVRSLLEQVAGSRIVVSAAPALADAVRDCLASGGLAEVAVAVAREPGSRRHTLIAGLEHLGVQQQSSIPVLVGDYRHPLVTGAVAALVLSGLRDGHGVAVPALPVTDTIKIVDDVGSVLRTVDRAALRTVQYPRGFLGSTLWQLVSADSGADEFDSALRAGFAIATVAGDADAVPVELPRDAHLLDAIIACRPD